MTTALKRLALLCCLPAWLTLASCDDKIDLKLNTVEPYLNLDGTLDDLPETADTIKLSSTIGYLDQSALPPVRGAQVVLSGSDGYRDTLAEVRPGRYLVEPGFAGRVGITYRLDIATSDNERYEASATMPRKQVLDSLTVRRRENEGPFQDGYYVRVWFRELPGKGDNLMFEEVRNDTLQNLPQNLFAVNDDLSDGQLIQGPDVNNQPYKLGDTVRVSVVSITEDARLFFQEMQVQINNGGLFAQPPANVRSNARNLNPNSNKRVTGYFLVRGKSTLGIRIR